MEEVEGGLLNTLTRMGERLAALEARNGAEIDALKRDTEAIRDQGHKLRNELQEFIRLMIKAQTSLEAHIVVCDHRGVRLERVGYGVATVVITILGFLLKQQFFPS